MKCPTLSGLAQRRLKGKLAMTPGAGGTRIGD